MALSPLQAALAQFAAQVQSASDETAPDLCNIYPPVATTDSGGRTVKTYPAPSNTQPLPCSYSPLSETKSAGLERMVKGQSKAVAFYKITGIPAATVVSAKSRVVVLARDTEPARTFEVLTVIRNAGFPLQLNCSLEE